MQRVGIGLTYEDFATSYDGSRQSTTQRHFPLDRNCRRHRCCCIATASRIVSKRWPIARVRIFFGSQRSIIRTALLQASFFGNLSRYRSRWSQWCQRIEAEQLRFGITSAVVRRCISQSIAWHDAVETTATDPMMDVPVFLGWIDKFNACSRRNDEPIGCLGDVATMVEPVGFDVGRKLLLHFASSRIATSKYPRILSSRCRCAPH